MEPDRAHTRCAECENHVDGGCEAAEERLAALGFPLAGYAVRAQTPIGDCPDFRWTEPAREQALRHVAPAPAGWGACAGLLRLRCDSDTRRSQPGRLQSLPVES